MYSAKAELEKAPKSFSVEKAHAAQRALSKHIITEDLLPNEICYVAGVDVAYTESQSIGGVVVINHSSLAVEESKIAYTTTKFPYIPTLLSFRELHPLLASIRKLELQPDVFLVDGHGLIHLNRLGLACHLGLILKAPTIGVAKGLLTGKVGEFVAGWAPITHEDSLIGVALLTGGSKNPIYVSIGHMVSLSRSMEIVKHYTKCHRIPKPLQIAHNLVTNEQRKLQKLERPTENSE
ncbi:MAG: endonuclease V [Candidatus Bathyarchaeota archaeon]|nr:MAG: endonuclease V [Candidatus Bathyarchaeota archaeon]